MKEYIPPISSRETYELIAIARSTTADWEEEAIDQAKNELLKRGVTVEDQQLIFKQWDDELARFELAKQNKLEQNAIEGYTLFEMLAIIILTPIFVSGNWGLGPSLIGLKRGNYKRKFKQRILLLLAGISFWITVGILISKKEERRRQEEIDSIDISEWRENVYDEMNNE